MVQKQQHHFRTFDIRMQHKLDRWRFNSFQSMENPNDNLKSPHLIAIYLFLYFLISYADRSSTVDGIGGHMGNTSSLFKNLYAKYQFSAYIVALFCLCGCLPNACAPPHSLMLLKSMHAIITTDLCAKIGSSAMLLDIPCHYQIPVKDALLQH